MADNMDLEDAEAPPSIDPSREVVAELDIYVAGPGTLGVRPEAQGYVLQFPQRPLDRPYADPARVQLKNTVKRMQWDIPLATGGPNYNPDADPSIRQRQFTLQSSRVDPGMQGLAVGLRRGNAVYLIPVAEVLQMRHSPAYLDAAKEKAEAEEEAGGSKKGGKRGAVVKQEDGSSGADPLAPITVQVKKHETEQQTEARLRSYAYHAQQEEADAWIDLRFRGADSDEAAALLDKIPRAVRTRAVPLAATMSPERYLDAIVPQSGPSMEDEGDEGAGAGDLGAPAPAVRHGAGQLTPEALAALPSQLALFFQHSHVLSLDNIRALLRNVQTHSVLNRAGETASDVALHKAVMEAGDFVCIRKSYTLKNTGNATVDPLRTAVLDLLREKDTIKRGDVATAAGAAGIEFSDGLYQKVMKELCTSRGAVWTLKTGSEGHRG
jgi:DNA-directed RNA polymerase-3 subunit RPC5